jgi:ribonuclease HI
MELERDHRNLTLELKHHSTKTSLPKRAPPALREFSTNELTQFRSSIHTAITESFRINDDSTAAMSSLTRTLTYEYNHIRNEKEEIRIKNQADHPTKLQHELESTRKAAKTLHKIIQLTGNLDGGEDVNSLCHQNRLLNPDDVTVPAKIARLNRKLSQLQNGHYLVNVSNDVPTWRENLIRMLKKATNRKRTITRSIRDRKIRHRVQQIIEYFADEPRKFFRRIKNAFQAHPERLTMLWNEQGEMSDNPKEVMEKFYGNLFTSKIDRQEGYRTMLKRTHLSQETKHQLSQRITHAEITEAILKLSNNKATGPDDIPAELYKCLIKIDATPTNSPITLVNALETHFNAFFLDGQKTPENWRTSVMILLHKGGSTHDIANYRPVTLINVIYKVYAHILEKRLASTLDEYNVLSEAQVGFRKQRTPSQKLLAVDAAIQKAKREKLELHMISLDIRKAFDSVEHWTIREALSEHGLGLPYHMVEAIMDTLTETSIQIRTDFGLTNRIQIGRGVRQGDPLSSTLFVLAIDPLLRALSQVQGLQITEGPRAYADDIDIITHSAIKAQELFDIVKHFLSVTGLELNEKKTAYGRNNVAHGNGSKASLLLNGNAIKEEPKGTTFRILGVQFDLDGDWKTHKKMARGCCIQRLKQLAKRKITDIQYVEVVNIVILAALTYGMTVVYYTEAELIELNSVIHSYVRRRLRIAADSSGWEAWLTLNKDKGGKAVYNIKDLHDANKINAFMYATLGPPSPAKTIIKDELEYLNTGKNKIRIEKESVWSPILATLKRRKASIHTTKRTATEGEIGRTLNEHDRTKPLRDLLDTLGMKINSMYDLLVTKDKKNTIKTPRKQTILSFITDRIDVSETQCTLLLSHIRQARRQAKLEINRIEGRSNRCSESNLGQLPNSRQELTVQHLGKEWQITFTDGSLTEDKGKAGWGVYFPKSSGLTSRNQAERYNPDTSYNGSFAFARVEGEQTNSRAELCAILAALKVRNGSLANQMIITDSSYAINEIENFPKRATKEKLRTKHRDVIEQILITKRSIRGEVKLLHVYSHQDKLNPDNPNDLQRITSIEKERTLIDNPYLYDLMVKGNDIADALANLATSETLTRNNGNQHAERRHRNWATHPTFGTDEIYITQSKLSEEGTQQLWIDSKIHAWIREHTQTQIMEVETNKAKKGKGKRNQYLLLLDSIDRKRSFASAHRKNHKRHPESTTLFKLRTHAYNTVEKLHRRGHQSRNLKLKTCFRSAYPDKLCPAHAVQEKQKNQEKLTALGVAADDLDLFETGDESTPPIEDTTHMLTCSARQSRKTAAQTAWAEARQLICAKQQPGAPDVLYLRPFGLRDPSIPTSPLPPLAGARGGRHSPDRFRSVRQVNAFPDNAAMLGLIPKGLVGALMELGVAHKEVDQLADELSQLIQSTLVRELWMRSRDVAVDREWAALYGKHVLGKQPRSHNKP